jgi:hypothetical protein
MLVNEQQNEFKNLMYLLMKVTGIFIILSEYNYKFSSKLMKCYNAKMCVCMCVSASLSENLGCRDKTIRSCTMQKPFSHLLEAFPRARDF